MNNEFWSDEYIIEEEVDELTRPDKRGKPKGLERKRKWREIETIKEQRRLRRDIEAYDQYSY
ncbi:DUF3545 family protein [Colwellia sp. E2M01]|uniref:DUF3545 family protein n=1 Tax=Colwellia sp. E2M01 TaxID=2841561 RepID=UPI001C09EA51|nr:DUF3545 family protein [Colwellia sp. E2M01]MBU2870003.1 DUF3545 family protein [Colwellia sp. E2M01]